MSEVPSLPLGRMRERDAAPADKPVLALLHNGAAVAAMRLGRPKRNERPWRHMNGGGFEAFEVSGWWPFPEIPSGRRAHWLVDDAKFLRALVVRGPLAPLALPDSLRCVSISKVPGVGQLGEMENLYAPRPDDAWTARAAA